MHWLHRQERIRWELEQLREHGFAFEEPTLTDAMVTVAVFVDIDGERHRLEADFFELFPYFRFEVRGRSLSLDHHQHPFGKNLCLMPRGTQHWETNQSLAAALKEQLPKVLATGKAETFSAASDAEDRQAEPVTTYFPSIRGSAMFFDGDIEFPADLTIARLTATRESDRGHPFRGVLTEVATLANETLHAAPNHLRRAGNDRIEGYVVRLPAAIFESDAQKLFDILRREHLQGQHLRSKASVIAVVVPEEHVWRKANGLGWLFLVKEKERAAYFVRPQRAGAEDLRARAPELAGLAGKVVAHFGLGCIGAVSAVELAKAGVGELRLLDHDIVDAGTVLRWYLGLPYAAFGKTETITNFVRAHYPLTSVIGYPARIGSTPNEREILLKMVDGASLVYDATAEPGVSYFLSELARRSGIPYVGVSGTQGGWGGVVARLRPGTTGCGYCLERAKTEGRIPAAPADPAGDVQPAGCDDPTFTGAGFDLASIALTGVRTAVATLLDGTGGYPAAPNDVTVVALRDTGGKLIQPTFTGIDCAPYPDCPVCGSGSR